MPFFPYIFLNRIFGNTLGMKLLRSVALIKPSLQLRRQMIFINTTHYFNKTVHSPTNALFIKPGRFKLYTRIHINFTPTCFGLRPSSGNLY
jgi:hypothetical protein